MKKIRLFSAFLAALMALTVAACSQNPDNPGGNSSADSTTDPFGKYESPITVTTMMLEDNIRNVPEGMTTKDNPWISLFAEYGINVEYKISGSQEELNTKLNMAIATNDLPDIMNASAQQFKDMAEADYLADLTSIYPDYISPEAKAMFEQDGGLMAKNGLINEKMLGLVQPQGYEDFVAVAAIRSDWMKSAGLEEPKKLSDIWQIAKTFKDKKMDGTATIAIGMTKNVLDLLTPTIGLLNGYHAYSNIWIDKNGSLENSSIQPEMKAALGKLAEYYKQGLIDPEFGNKDTTKLMEDAISGKSGVVISHFCAPFDTMNGVKNGQEWAYYRIPSDDDQVVKAQESIGFSSAICYSKKGKNPEAMIKMFNIFTKYVKDDPAKYNDNAIRNFAYPTQTASISGNNSIHKEYLSFLETGKKPDSVTDGYDSTVEAAEKYRKSKDIEGYTMWAVFGPEGTQNVVDYAIANDGYILNKFTGAPTESMQKYSANLKTMEEQMVTYIIKGTKPLSYFDEFVASWKKNGGDEITKEVNDWYKNNK